MAAGWACPSASVTRPDPRSLRGLTQGADMQHDLVRCSRWAPAHPHLPRWRGECACFLVSPWFSSAREVVDWHDEHVAKKQAQAKP